MHELAVARNIVEVAEEAAAGRPVLKVTVEIGTETQVSAEALAFSFDVVAAGTVVAGAELEIRDVAGDRLNITSLEVEERG
jgi:hydrogenase nickel incorporation protein HypA/HybF